jgi:hypothetical protein
MGQVRQEMPFAVEDLGPHRYREADQLATAAMSVGAFPVATAVSNESTLALEEGEIAEIGISDEYDIATVASVAAVGPTLRHVLLAPEAERSVAAAAPLNLDPGPVVEHWVLAN